MKTQTLKHNLQNREHVIKTLKKELIGPSPAGEEIDCESSIIFEDNEQFYLPRRQLSGEEIIQRHTPKMRYGAGILYPFATPLDELEAQDNTLTAEGENEEAQAEIYSKQALKDIENIEEIKQSKDYEREEDDFDISTANSFNPSSMAVSFCAELPKGSKLVVCVTGGRYSKKKVYIKTDERDWWLRRPVNFTATCDADELLGEGNITRTAKIDMDKAEGLENIDLRVEILSRWQENGVRLFTVCLINRTQNTGSSSLDELCLFQSHFEVYIDTPDKKSCILPYPEPGNDVVNEMDMEEQSLALLYRKVKTYAIGHGCAADWDKQSVNDRVYKVSAESLPVYETPSMTPDVVRKDGTSISASMLDLAGLNPESDGLEQLEEIIDLYEEWIHEQEYKAGNLDIRYQEAAFYNLNQCKSCVTRMREGLSYLKNNKQAYFAFQLANHAILLQQISGQTVREGIFDEANHEYIFDSPYVRPDVSNVKPGRGNWRAFQIAFILMSLRSAVEGEAPDREIVELIWFPTGGGKTEAYLGLMAFSLFMRRLQNPDDNGVHVIMRYTLRLLTADQFQRASRLICAMEYLRRQNEEKLGSESYSIGLWLGGETTPNTRKDATAKLNELKKGKTDKNPFIIRSCPWCGAKFGVCKAKEPQEKEKDKKRGKNNRNKQNHIAGYKKTADGSVAFKCADPECDFSKGLPVHVIDEDIYEYRPSLVIGTVDKFAMLTWKPVARSLFGIGENGERFASPPGLIIQDELHLISGPLGSITGLYETVIEEFCTDRRNGKMIKPKIVCSTATIRRYKEQIGSLYARENVTLFPAPGLDADDSFFTRYAVDEDGNLMPGRMYVGINTPSLGSMQTLQVRAFTSALLAPVSFSKEERDPWWTFLAFFNSLRELGTTLTLLQSDIPNYMLTVKQREGLGASDIRYINRIKELTSRLTGDEVSEAIDDLKVDTAGSQTPIDICLASNIIEVGVDIDRLSLMTVVGQPKTTAQYIQVTGRVGRRAAERPGLILTLYNASKPRDRSHFERFRSYHEKLYTYVEPTSVTPFSAPAIDRALHSVIVAYVRQTAEMESIKEPYPFSDSLINEIRDIVIKRVRDIDPEEEENVIHVFDKRIRHWKRLQPVQWEKGRENDNSFLLRVAGAYANREEKKKSWPTMMSMRNVDAGCKGKISDIYQVMELEE